MHEISLVKNIFSTLKSELTEAELKNLKNINLTVGLLSNVEPILMQNAFEAVVATESQEFKGASLQITVLPIKVECKLCNSISEINNYKFVCQNCNNPTNNIIQGNELLLSKVDFN